VTDANNNALPFANITNTIDNVGTYSDAQGNFTLVSPDSVMNVQVRSLGFTSNNIQLRNYVTDNKVMMQEDRSLPVDTIDKVKRNIKRNRNNTMTLEEPEPEDGWDSYGSYVVNNLNIPDKFEMKKTGETADNTVEVSFEVNKNGEPINIKVEKSLCDKCDKEAVRLIKEGPKWKRKAKKSKRTTITVPFIKPE
jgi:TonB family protein